MLKTLTRLLISYETPDGWSTEQHNKFEDRMLSLATHQSHLRQKGRLRIMSTTIIVPDKFNPVKSHMFRIYKSGHVCYDQLICGTRFYKRLVRTNRKHGYRDLLPPPGQRITHA